MKLPARRDVRRRFWSAVALGASSDEAAAAAGVEHSTGGEWFRQAGGVAPSHLQLQLSGRYLSLAEREEIFAGVERGESIRQMARNLRRAPSTVLRELRRNMLHQYRTRSRLSSRRGRPRILPWDYRPSLAQGRADHQAARPKLARLAREHDLRKAVQDRLLARMSPEQIAAHLRREFADDPSMHVSHETIYQSIYVQGRGALRRELAVCLRSGRALRHPQRRGNQRRTRIPDMVNISERPAEVEDRAIPGHWEGDLLMGKNNRSAIGTLVERSTRFLILLYVPKDHSAEAIEAAMIDATQRLPRMPWKSLTWDQGSEMTNHARISIATHLDIYFCDPASPWQRGSNENTNGLLRQYFPKGTDLSGYHPDYLEFVSAQMNARPRKTLGWDTPAEALERLLSEPSNPRGVASTA
jgi:transposase, IS30 family